MLKALVPFFVFALFSFAVVAQENDQTPLNEGGAVNTRRIIEMAANHDLDLGAIQHPELFSAIDEWYGTPYRFSGESKQGIDCSGFVTVLYKNIYNIQLTGGSRDIFNKCIPIDKQDLKEGDLLFFTIAGGRISHVGYYLSNNKFIHATTRGGVLISDLEEPYYKRYFYKAGRVEQLLHAEENTAL